MKYIEDITSCVSSMNKITKVLIKFGIICSIIIYFIALMLLVLSDELFPDYNTGFYWFEQTAFLGKEMLAALTLPALIGEIIMFAAGLNKK